MKHNRLYLGGLGQCGSFNLEGKTGYKKVARANASLYDGLYGIKMG